MLKEYLRKGLTLFFLPVLVLVVSLVPVKASAFVNGADIGWLSQLEAMGMKWQNAAGVSEDPLKLLKDNGVNAVRLRVFVNPPSNFIWNKNGAGVYLGFTDQAGVLAAATRAKNAGMDIFLDIHYSDHFADPACQDKPAAWANDSFDKLQTDVYSYTYNLMTALKNNGTVPKWVQVGNEINSGMLLPSGSTSNFNNLAALINQGYNAVKAVSSSSQVVIHLANGYNNSTFRWFFDSLKAAGGKFDVIGASYYPYWDGAGYIDDQVKLAENLNDMASRYGKPVMVCEVGGHETDPVGTYNTVLGAINTVKNVPNGMGIGVFYWEPEANSSVLPDAYGLGACSKVSENLLKFTTAINAFKGVNDSVGNLLENPSFESNGKATQTPNGWAKWGTSGACYTESNGGAHTGNYYATHWKSSAYSCSNYQNLSGLANGKYTLTAWVKSSGGQSTAQMYAKNYGGAELDYKINYAIGSWTQITISDIDVKNRTIEVGFYSEANANNWINFDDVSLTKSTNPVKLGDVNGDDAVDALDFAMMKSYLIGIIRDFPVENGIEAADVNVDNRFDALDLAAMKQYLLGIIKQFPAQ